jgi:hypothetical protein
MVRLFAGAAAILAVVAVLVLCAAAFQSTALPSDLSALAAAAGSKGDEHHSAHAKIQAAKSYPRAAGFLQPLAQPGGAADAAAPDSSPAGSFGSEKVWPAKQVFHSHAVFGSKNNFGPLSHFKEGSHFEDGNTFEDGASFGMDSHFGVCLHTKHPRFQPMPVAVKAKFFATPDLGADPWCVVGRPTTTSGKTPPLAKVPL